MAEQVKTEAEAFAENFSVAPDSGATPAQEASYAESRAFDAARAHEQYGGNRYLRVADGKIENARYGYQRQSLQSHHHARQSGHHRAASQNWARPSHPGFRDSSWEVKSSGNDPIAPANWWRRFWSSVGVNLRDR